jgi:hypothetical protein
MEMVSSTAVPGEAMSEESIRSGAGAKVPEADHKQDFHALTAIRRVNNNEMVTQGAIDLTRSLKLTTRVLVFMA